MATKEELDYIKKYISSEAVKTDAPSILSADEYTKEFEQSGIDNQILALAKSRIDKNNKGGYITPEEYNRLSPQYKTLFTEEWEVKKTDAKKYVYPFQAIFTQYINTSGTKNKSDEELIKEGYKKDGEPYRVSENRNAVTGDYTFAQNWIAPKTNPVEVKKYRSLRGDLKPPDVKPEPEPKAIEPAPTTKTEEKSYADLARVQPGKELPDDVKAYMSQLALGKPVQFKPVMPTFNADATAQGGIDAPGSTVLRGALQGLTRRLGSEIDYAGFKYGTLKKLEDVYGTTFRQIKPEEYNKIYEPINQKYQQLQAETENLSNLEKQRVELFNAKKDTKELDAQIAEKKIVIAKLQKEVEEGVVRLQSASTFGEEARDPNALIAGTTQEERARAIASEKINLAREKFDYQRLKDELERDLKVQLATFNWQMRTDAQERAARNWLSNAITLADHKRASGQGDTDLENLITMVQKGLSESAQTQAVKTK